MRNKIHIIAVLAMFSFASCYEDLGTIESDYHEINELTVEGIEDYYNVDVDDSLRIDPIVTGTQYSDTSKFTFAWEIANEIIDQNMNLALKVNMVPGSKIARFIVQDKETMVKKYHRFNINVSSSTAGNLLMVLSKSSGKAELSYLRLDREDANWAVNYYEGRFGESLGTNPQRLSFILLESDDIKSAPFVNEFGRVLVQVDDQIRLLDKSSLEPDPVPVLTGEAYTGINSYPPADVSGFKPEFMDEGIYTWRSNAYGSGFQKYSFTNLISGGALYFAALAPSIWTNSFSYNNKSVYGENGYFSAYGYYDDMIPREGKATLTYHGYELGNFIVFDRVYGRFSYTSGGRVSSIPTTDVKEFTGYDMIYGSATSEDATSFAVLSDGSNTRFVLLGKLSSSSYSLVGESEGGEAKANSKFYNMKTSPYLFFTAGNKLYKYNILEVKSNIGPDVSNQAVALSDYGYAADAVITSLCVSRTERTLILGVSRYGTDANGSGDENKGDLLVFDLDQSSLKLTLREKYEGISGIPVDVKIKYQTHWRDGKANDHITYMDQI